MGLGTAAYLCTAPLLSPWAKVRGERSLATLLYSAVAYRAELPSGPLINPPPLSATEGSACATLAAPAVSDARRSLPRSPFVAGDLRACLRRGAGSIRRAHTAKTPSSAAARKTSGRIVRARTQAALTAGPHRVQCRHAISPPSSTSQPASPTRAVRPTTASQSQRQKRTRRGVTRGAGARMVGPVSAEGTLLLVMLSSSQLSCLKEELGQVVV